MWGREAKHAEDEEKQGSRLCFLLHEAGGNTSTAEPAAKKIKGAKTNRKVLGRSSGPPSPTDEAGSRSHPSCFSAPREEKGELADADSEELLEMKTIFRQKFWNVGRRPGRSGRKGHTAALQIVFSQHTGGGHW